MTRRLDIISSQHSFQFTRRWFRERNLETFREYVHPEWKDEPINYLELGVFEGQSMTWMMQHVLTHEDARSVGVDPWLVTRKMSGEDMEDVMQRARHNLSPWTSIEVKKSKADLRKCTLIRGTSSEVLRRMLHRRGEWGMKKENVDLCMVDGSHYELLVLDDARLCSQLLKPGGWMLFDDVENDKTKMFHVKQGLAMFLDEEPRMKLLWKHRYMEAYQKGE